MRLVDKDSTAATLTLTDSVKLDKWTLSFRLPGGQKLVRGKAAAWHQSGDMVVASGSGGLPKTTSFEAAYDDAATLPQSFTLNDVPCPSELSAAAPPPVAKPVAQPTRAKAVVPKKPAKRAAVKKTWVMPAPVKHRHPRPRFPMPPMPGLPHRP
jgi:hypothetical protein